jgi:2-polyprenyl-3-methyl-5-hydroxy-6-metoxy-1,4-benzoquinol methylase
MEKVMDSCNLCRSPELTPLIDFGNQPIAKHYLSEPSEVGPTYPVQLYFCEHCGLTQLVNSCPPEILYDNYVTLSSWKFQPHVQHQIDVLKGLSGINSNSKIIEIGSNDGIFLQQLSENGFKNTLGIEPAKDAYDLSVEKGINTKQIFLNEESSAAIKKEYEDFDIFISRQNLEHMGDLQVVAESIKNLVKDGGYVLIEVPNFSCNLKNKDYSLWEEHVNYFTLDTLRYFLSLANIEIINQEIFCFSGEGIFIIGQKVGTVNCTLDYVPNLRAQNIQYSLDWPIFKKDFSEFLLSQKREGKKIGVYGAGARVFCLINFADVASYIDVIVDDQVEKQNKFMPGGRLPIMSSEALYSVNIDICLLGVNAENENKVVAKHAEWVKSRGKFWSVLPPSERLLPIWE